MPTKILRRIALIVVPAIIGALAACSVGPNYVKPAPGEVPAAFKEMDGWKRSEPKDGVLRGKWWELFGDERLNSLEEAVDISNQNLAQAEAQYRQAKAAVKGARAGYFPTVSAGLSATRSHAAGSGRDADLFALPVEVSWEPDLWGKVKRTVEGAKAQAQASGAELEGVRLSAHALLAQDYLALRSADLQRKILAETVERYRKSLELTQNRYGVGVASRADVLQAETQLKDAQARLIDIGITRSQLEHAIAILVGKPASTFALPDLPLDTLPPAIPVAVPSEVLERRPDVAAAERLVAAANARVGLAEAAYYPSITLSASGGFQAVTAGSLLSLPSRFWSVGAGLAQTLFDGGARKALTDEAKAAYDAQVAAYRQTVLTSFQEVEDQLAQLRLLQDEARTEDEAVHATRQGVEVVLNRYHAGLTSYLDVVVAQAAALGAEQAAADILGRRMAGSVLLIKALGGGWDGALP